MDPSGAPGGGGSGGYSGGAASEGSPQGGGGPPGGFQGPPDPSRIPSPPTELAKSIATALAGVGVALNVISFLVFTGRVYTRTVPVIRLAWDDYTIALAYVMILVHSVMLLLTTPYAFGTRDPNTFTMQDVINSNKYAIISQPLWAWSMALIKVSVAIMLLRLEPAKNMRRFLWFMIAVQAATCIYNTVVQAVQCFPFEAAWDLLGLIPDARCLSRQTIGIHQIVIASINIATDVVFALLPISFLRKVQRPLREKIIIGILMALGLFAAVASVMKAETAARFGRTDDPNAEGITIGTWSLVEEQVAFIAACVPCLRALFQSAMVKLGIATTKKSTTKPSAGSGTPRGFTGKTARSGSSGAGPIRLKTLTTSDSPSEENILPTQGTTEIWRTTELKMEEDNEYMREKWNKEHRGIV